MPSSFRTGRRPRATGCAALLAACCALGAGCGTAKAPSGVSAKKRGVNDAKAEQAGSALPAAITGRGWHIPWVTRDPKNPQGPVIPLMVADARTGAMSDENRNVVIDLGGVHVQLYREGAATGDIEAPRVTADERTRVVIGTGGVTVRSRTDPPDTVIKADKIAWDTRAGRIVAVGHARVHQLAHDGSPAISQSGGRITFDTTFKNIDVQAQ